MFLKSVTKSIINILIAYLERPSSQSLTTTSVTLKKLTQALQPGDVLLVEGKQKFSSAIKYLTQSNWSHAALYIGEGTIIEADLKLGVIKVNIDKYQDYHTRICRPVAISDSELKIMIKFIENKEGFTYDIKNIFDLAKYLLPAPPVPSRWKRKVLEFGSQDTTKVICSSIIAQAFQYIKYPVLPMINCVEGKEVYLTRHHTFFTPSDFDRSPYFQIIKPTLVDRFDYKEIPWSRA